MKKSVIAIITAVMMTLAFPVAGFATETPSTEGNAAEAEQVINATDEEDALTLQDTNTDEAVSEETQQDTTAEPSATEPSDAALSGAAKEDENDEELDAKALAARIPKTKYKGAQPAFPNAIAQQAIKIAFKYGTAKSKMTYPGASAKPEFQKAIQQAYGARKGWGKQTRAGASCDVFVGTVVRSCGYDTKFPRGLEEDLKYLPNSKFTELGITKKKEFQPGDIILYNNKGSGGHIAIYVEIAGKGYLAEASYSWKRYGRITKAHDWTPSHYKSYGVFRPSKACMGPIQYGDYNSGVKALQQFLNWAGFDCGTPDGDFGKKTEEAVKLFQKSQGLEADGEFGSKSYAAAQKYTNWGARKMLKGTNPIVTKKPVTNNAHAVAAKSAKKTSTTTAKAPAKKAYTGALPTKTIKYKSKKKGEVKKWQKFLKWYGYPVKVDGKFGKGTKKYTKKFQKKVGLKATGKVGKKTVAKAKAVKK